MYSADVTAISLVTDKTRDEICETLIPYVARALANQCVKYQRLPITTDYMDWVINDTDQLTVALDEAGERSIILLVTRGEVASDAMARLANIAADLCRDYAVHTLFWNGADRPIDAEDFLYGDLRKPAATLDNARRIKPRRVRAPARDTARPVATSFARAENASMKAMRTQMTHFTADELEEMTREARRATSVPLRLSAWALSISTAVLAAPLAIPLIVHNLIRGEDVRAGAMSFGVAGLFAVMAQTGMAPELVSLL